jgi:hypothetical protein
MNIHNLLEFSTKNITINYFQLPIYGKEDPIYRERVYCYELYHQLRTYFPENTDYGLFGEIDKSGHPVIRNNNLDLTKPDFLIHNPGRWDDNLVIIEVKPINAANEGIKKDLITLTAFRRHANYQKAIYLFYGDGDIVPKLTKVHDFQTSDENNEIDLNLIEFWWHKEVGEKAIKVFINNEV